MNHIEIQAAEVIRQFLQYELSDYSMPYKIVQAENLDDAGGQTVIVYTEIDKWYRTDIKYVTFKVIFKDAVPNQINAENYDDHNVDIEVSMGEDENWEATCTYLSNIKYFWIALLD